jgi:hypothetical protein
MYPVEEFYLEDVLTLTSYSPPAKRGKNSTSSKQPAISGAEQSSLQELTSQLTRTPAQLPIPPPPPPPLDQADDVVVENR